jgi:hypothetical protein
MLVPNAGFSVPKTEYSLYTQSGFKCSYCFAHCKTYNEVFPSTCPSCGQHGVLTMEWNQQVMLRVITTPLPLVPIPAPIVA